MTAKAETPKKTTSALGKRLLVGLFLFIVGLYLAIWAFSPWIARWQINQQLESYQLRLSDDSSLRFNPFILELSINQLKLTRLDSNKTLAAIEQAVLDIETLPLFSKTVALEKFSIKGFHFESLREESHLDLAGFIVSTLEQPASTQQDSIVGQSVEAENDEGIQAQKPWLIIADHIDLDELQFNFDNQGRAHSLKIVSLDINEARIDQTGQDLAIKIVALIDQAELDISLVLNHHNNKGELNLELEMLAFDLNNVGYLLSTNIEDLNGKLSFDFKNTLLFEGDKINLDLPSLNLTLEDLSLATDKILLTSQIINAQLDELQVKVESDQLPTITVSTKLLSTETQVTTKNKSDLLLAYKKLALEDGHVSVHKNQLEKFAFQTFSIDALTFSQKQFEAEKRLPAIAKLEKLVLSDLAFNNKNLSLDTIHLEKLNAAVLLDNSKALANLVELTEKPTNSDNKTAAETITNDSSTDKDIEKESLGLILNKLTISESSQFTFQDASVSPKFVQKLQVNKFEIGQVNNKNLALETPFDIQLKTDAFAVTSLKGKVKPFGQKVNVSLESSVREFSLPKVSPYMKGAMGFEMLNGQFDSDVKMTIVEDIIQGNAQLKVRGMDLSSSESDNPESLEKQSSMPLNSALGLLMDDKGNLQLDMPLSGDISAPEFGVSTFIAQITKKAVMSAAQSYLIDTFIPYASVLSVVMVAGEHMLKVSFEDLLYSEGATQVSEDQNKFIREFALLLKDQPDTQVKVCALAIPADLKSEKVDLKNEEDREKLLAISEERGNNFKALLIKDYAVTSANLLLCQPQIDSKKGAKPRIKFEI